MFTPIFDRDPTIPFQHFGGLVVHQERERTWFETFCRIKDHNARTPSTNGEVELVLRIKILGYVLFQLRGGVSTLTA